MNFRRKSFVSIILLFSFLLIFSSMVWADHPQDGNHDIAEMPADCVGCHNSEGGTNYSVVGEHRFRLGVDNHRLCAYCHYNPSSPFFNDPTFHWDSDPDLAVAVTFGRRNTNPRGYIEPVYCAYCHVTENRSTHDHVGEHDHAEVPLSCRGCHGNNLKEVHIDPDKNLPRDADLPPAGSAGYAEAYAAGLLHLKLSCYTCHGETVIGTAPWDLGRILFEQDPVVRTVVASGIAGSDVTCEACHPVPDHAGAHDHAVITAGNCVNCHSDNVVTEHITDHGLSCATCHSSPDPVVIAAIDLGSSPSNQDVDCLVCHLNANHEGAHDHAILPVGENCGSCHASNVVVEHLYNHNLSCATCHESTDQLVVDAIALGSTPSNQDVDCHACHGEVDHSNAHNRIFLRTRLVDGSETIITSTDSIVDSSFDDLPPYRPSLTCGICHHQIADNHWGNYHSGLRMGELLDENGTPVPRGTLDPARPWVSGPGLFGNWCPTYQRQLADMNASFATESEFLEKVDLAAFDFLRECAICHVGGGPGADNPFGYNIAGLTPHSDHDNPERAIALDTDETNGNHNLVPLNAWDFHVENGTVVRNKWITETGVLDVDCLMCHLEDYNHLDRNQQIRHYTQFANAATIGAGLGVIDETASAPDNFAYNSTYVKRDETNQLYLDWNVTRRIARIPKSANCLACHMSDMVMHENEATEGDLWETRFYADRAIPDIDPTAPNLETAVKRNDFLKRGATWRRDEVHKFMECSGCHSKTGKFSGHDLHSPGKGIDPLKFSSDADGTVKMCEDCHVLYGDLDGDRRRDTQVYGPPEMQVYHYQAGLMANIVPRARRIVDADGNEDEFLGNHIDIISCTACHVEKRYAAARSVDFSSGKGYHNLVGTPPDQVPGSDFVPLAYSWRENTPVKVIGEEPNPYWRRQIYPFNYLTSIYWDNNGSTDANGDGYRTGNNNNGTTVIGDPFFMRHIEEHFNFDFVNPSNDRVASGLIGVTALDQRSEWTLAGQDGNVMFTQPEEIDAFQSLMQSVNVGYTPRLNLEARPFLVVHNIMPIQSTVGLSGSASYALGTPIRDANGLTTGYGCGQCHGGSAGIFNGAIEMLGDGVEIGSGTPAAIEVSWNDIDDVKTSARAWQRDGTEFEIDFVAANRTRAPERREFLGYDAARVTALNAIVPADVGVGVDPVADILSIGGVSASGPQIEIVKGSADVELVAADAGTVGSFQYRWNINDVAGTLIGQTVSKTFSQTGIWIVRLTVVDEEGRISQNAQKVNVVPSAAATQVAVVVTAGSPTVTLQLSSLPLHDQVRFYFGDGTDQFVSDAADSLDLNRDYRLRDTYRMLYDPDTGIRHDPTNDPISGNEYEAWVYKTSIRLYLDGEWVDKETVNVSVVIRVL